MTYPFDSLRVSVYRADPDALTKLAAADVFAAAEGLTEIETNDVIERIYSRPVQPPAPPWWAGLKAGDKVRAKADGCPVMTETGALVMRGKAGAVWDVWAPGVNLDRATVCVYNGSQARYPGGLWVAAGDVEPA